MRRKIGILIAVTVFFVTGVSALSFSQEKGKTGSNPMAERDVMKSDMMFRGVMMEKCPMYGLMMKGMMEKLVIAAADGGVIVLAGNKLIKYDKDLNLVKEVEIKIDMEGMKKEMAEMMKDCPMMKGGMAGYKSDQE